MRCEEVQKLLSGELQLDSTPVHELEVHLSTCAACQAVRRDLVSMRTMLRSETPPPLPDGFELELRRRLAEEAARSSAPARERSHRSSRRQVILALAASVLLVASGVMIWRSLAPAPDADASFHKLELSVRSTESVSDVQFDIALPEGVELAPGAGAALVKGRSLRWQSDLRPGVNAVVLPLVATTTPARIEARLTLPGRSTIRTAVVLSRSARRAEDSARAIRLAWVIEPDLEPDLEARR
jgi:hypothetical protein